MVLYSAREVIHYVSTTFYWSCYLAEAKWMLVVMNSTRSILITRLRNPILITSHNCCCSPESRWRPICEAHISIIQSMDVYRKSSLLEQGVRLQTACRSFSCKKYCYLVISTL